MADCHYWFAKLLTTGERLSNDGTLLKEPKIDEAEKHFNRAIKINPNFAKAYYRLGLLLYSKKAYLSALDNFEHAIKLDPNFSKAHYSLAVLLMSNEASKIIEKELLLREKKTRPRSRSVSKKAK